MNIIPSLTWLVLGGFLRLFDFGRWTIPISAWLAPVFLLHFTRTNDPLIGTAAIWLAIFISSLFAYRGLIPLPGFAYPITLAFIGITTTLPYLVDRLLAGQIPGFASTLVFPLAWVVVEFITARTSPFGTWGSVAYTQYGNRSLMQLASITGLPGITFLVTWFGSSVNWVWDNQFDWYAVQTGLLTYGIAWSLVMIFGGARLALTNSTNTVRVAAIGWPNGILGSNEILKFILSQQIPDRERGKMREVLLKLHDYFLEESRREARAGAKMVIWPEGNLMVFHEDEISFMERARQLAREEQIYLLMGMAAIRQGDSRPLENKAVLVDPSGGNPYSYIKSRPVPGWEAMMSVRGDGRIPTLDTRYGRVGSTICYDMDFPHLIRQVGKARVDTVLVPASDWEAIKQVHHAMAVFRAIENGTSMVRATRWGVSTAVDPLGRTLAILDDFVAAQGTMVAQVPTLGTPTIYAQIGDLFAWLCAAGLLGTFIWVLLPLP